MLRVEILTRIRQNRFCGDFQVRGIPWNVEGRIYRKIEDALVRRVGVKFSIATWSLHHSQTWQLSVLSSHSFVSFLPPLHRYSTRLSEPSCVECFLYLHSIFLSCECCHIGFVRVKQSRAIQSTRPVRL